MLASKKIRIKTIFKMAGKSHSLGAEESFEKNFFYISFVFLYILFS